MDRKLLGLAAQEKQQEQTLRRSGDPHIAPESDSGFSDVASECLSSVEQTDTEEASLTARWSAALNPSEGPAPHPPPLLILKNLLVDQGSSPDPPIHSWTVHPSFQLLPTASQILVFPSSIPPVKPQPSIEKTTKYLPILNSYPKIAPHPSQLPRRGHKREAEAWHQNQTKRQLPGLRRSGKKTDSLTTPEGPVLSDVAPDCDPDLATAQNETKDCEGTDDTDLQAATFSVTSHKTRLPVPPEQENKSRRFQNTLDVLHRSGLLSIAIKTKELARLNQATQIQLEKLQEQMSLYTKALSSNDPEDWQKLQESLPQPSGLLKEISM
ncbi:CLOCK-interacting pacemaker [Mantella aurantiaca]